MRFLVDAQLPVRLAARLTESGHDAMHTSALPDGNRSTDAQVAAVADREDRIVVSKDTDFRHWHWLRSSPRRLLVVATGNISNPELLDLFTQHLDAIVDAFTEADFVELTAHALVVHPRGD